MYNIHNVRAQHGERVAMGTVYNCFHFGSSHENFDYMANAELHLHLEGTVDPATARLLDPAVTPQEVDAAWQYTDFQGFIACFQFIARRLKTPEDYALITRRMMRNLSAQGVNYAEVTLAAGVVLWRELDFDAVWRAVRAAQFDEFQQSPVEIHWNLDAIRQFGADHVLTVAKLAAKYAGDGAISFGIGGDEHRGPAHLFGEAYRYAGDAGLRLTCHAGETAGPQSIVDALAIGAERIGHGVHAIDDPYLLARLRDENIPLEVCITSNIKTGAIADLDAHPVKRLFDAGVPITLNTDDPGMFDCTLASEFALAASRFGFSPAELQTIRDNAWKYAFAPARGMRIK